MCIYIYIYVQLYIFYKFFKDTSLRNYFNSRSSVTIDFYENCLLQLDIWYDI